MSALNAALDLRFPPGQGDAADRLRREQALAAFEAVGFPTRRIEEWRYTDLRSLEQAAFDPAPAAPTPDAVEQARAALCDLPYADGTPFAVFVDGAFAPSLSSLPAVLAAALQSATVSANAPGHFVTPEPRHALAALNDALASRTRIVADHRFDAAEPLVIVFVSATPGVAAHINLGLTVTGGTTIRVVQHFVSAADAGSSWINLVFDIDQAPDSKVDVTRIQTLADGHSLTSLIRPTLADRAALTIGSIDFGGALIRTDIETALNAPGAAVDLFGLATAAAGQHVDNHVCADHRAPDTRSTQVYRSLVDERGRVVFNGKVIVRPGSQRIDAAQSSDNLLLSRNAEVDTKPELEIYADDVRCSHGATVGELDTNELFYLQSRGIPVETARRLLTFGFANRILMRFSDAELRHWLGRRLSGSLHELPELADMAFESAEQSR